MNSSSIKVAKRFTNPNAKTLDKIAFYCVAKYGTCPTYRIGLQAVSPATNLPTGTWLTSATFTITVAGRQLIDVSDYSISGGTTYAVVIQYESGTIDGSNYMKVRAAGANQSMIPLDCSADSMLMFIKDTGAGWALQYIDPTFLLVFPAPPGQEDTFGQPYYVSTLGIIQSATFYGEEIHPPSDKWVNTIDVYVKKVGSPADDLTIVLHNITDGTDEATVTITAAELTTSYQWISKSISATQILSSKVYRLYGKSTGSSYPNYYAWLVDYSSGWESATWNGATDHRLLSTNSGSSWIDYTGDFPFRFTETTAPVVQIPQRMKVGVGL